MIAKFMNHLRKAERGQSIIILAIAFVVLLGFVGLTTDVSLMFVRYATIRRAVDSASLAAATQMRQGTEEAAVAIAARQFVEFHGLSSVNVKVDTCQTLDRESNDPEVAALVAELCTADQRKLVKVTVQAESPTVFLRLLGWENFTLQASAISETAALDVILIMDVSESMLLETTYDDWAKIGMGWAFKPPHIEEDIADTKAIDRAVYWESQVVSQPQAQVNARLWFTQIDAGPVNTGDDADYVVESIQLDNSPKYDAEYGFPDNASEKVPREDCRVRLWPNSVRARPTTYPGRDKRVGGSNPDNASAPDTLALHETATGLNGGLYGENGAGWSYGNWNGFVPTYNYYGCCNDPGTHKTDIDDNPVYNPNSGYVEIENSSADFDFTDLICQPFKGARDAVELFLEKIDFIRGDRVGFVTFDRSAFLVNPWNLVGQSEGGSHMIERYDYALLTLRRVIGVRAEPNFYVWDDNIGTDADINASWGALASGIKRVGGIAASSGINYNTDDGDGYLHTKPGQVDGYFNPGDDILYNYPVMGNCPFWDAALSAPYSRFDGSLGQVSLPYRQNRSQSGASQVWNNYHLFNHPVAGAVLYSNPNLTNEQIARISYDMWSSCRGTNIGAALREGNNALLDPNTSRRFGAIWVMVLLGDGAAGASDPVRRNEEKLDTALPYVINDSTGLPDPQPGEYGSFGVCPYGTPPNPGEVVNVLNDWVQVGGPAFPYCSDEDPASRHDCDFRPAVGQEAMQDADYVAYPWAGITGPPTAEVEIQWNQDRGNLFDVDIEDCSLYYDVDDYARDWADYIAVKDQDSATEELLPTIYTIGFGLRFGNEADPDPNNYMQDYLGEQMLRYIADAGDNNQIDNDYYQHFAEDVSLNDPDALEDGYGLRGACQDQSIVPGGTGYDFDNSGTLSGQEIADMYQPLPPRENCGNYFNAPTADELEFVFDSIASKLFTRLAG